MHRHQIFRRICQGKCAHSILGVRHDGVDVAVEKQDRDASIPIKSVVEKASRGSDCSRRNARVPECRMKRHEHCRQAAQRQPRYPDALGVDEAAE